MPGRLQHVIPAMSRRALKHRSRLGRKDLYLLAQIGYLFARVMILQRTRSLPELVAAFDGARPRGGGPDVRTSPRRLVWLIDGIMRSTLRERYCMKRSLILFHFLRKWGYDARILFGVRKLREELTGHAWIEVGGVPFAEPADPGTSYVRTFAYPR